MLLSDKTALITGAARGMGRVCARLLTAEGAAVELMNILPEGEDAAAELRGGARLDPFSLGSRKADR